MQTALEICKAVADAGGRAYFIGGWVRDKVMGKECRDIDIEVYGLEPDKLEALLCNFEDVNFVGKQFGVYKIGIFRMESIDVSLPRTESKIGVGHKDFEVVSNPFMTMYEAILRRDLTINSLFYDPLDDCIVDVTTCGKQDIQDKVLRYNDRNKFREDPLRVYRVMQFIGRLGFTPTAELSELCREMVQSGELDTVPKERVYEEFSKLLVKSEKPSLGLQWALGIGLIEKYFPELYKLKGIEQDPQWHKEGDVWTHTMMALDAGAGLKESLSNVDGACDEEYVKKRQMVFMLGVLCHDLGKGIEGITETDADGTIHSRRHESEGEEPTLKFLDRLTDDIEIRKKVVFLVTNHMTPLNLYNAYLLGSNPKNSAFRRLGIRAMEAGVGLNDLLLLTHADNTGRVSTVGSLNDGIIPWFNERLAGIEIKGPVVPKPLITGDDLMGMGMKQGVELGKIHKEAYRYQIEFDIQDKEYMVGYVGELLRTEKEKGVQV